MKTIRCAGVPEHFNFPWQLALRSGDFESAGINLNWQNAGGGTGAMAKDLQEGKVDLAVMLTEGAITEIVGGNPSRIVSTYVQSPLNWGVHTSAKASISNVSDAVNKPFAISRYNSGSHLMAYVYGKNKGFDLGHNDFNLVQNLDGARHSLKENPEQLFLWEKYTTKPLVDCGEFKIIDHCPTPWPSFVIVVRKEFLLENEQLIDAVLGIVKKHTEILTANPEAASLIANEYHLEEGDAKAWYETVSWELSNDVDENMLVGVSEVLSDLDILVRPLHNVEVRNRLLHSMGVGV
ncbi:ABC-type nitrate/sulfonate/bicarbonate transport system, periplasmic component [Owenweeksia hongkongensis DSM 17368]|uniref:ABC-type nitrate/sulfonate/bicarbonate transport system, periplasmic component n=1 Tax=Owenweeksia hongkongensis (strain DSM 17368 / CIP 108786 / JCM 12287 / NRRL B-23963 / UST20020801) TaxID=926562 RepID=G8R4Z4_OWEHD|nr:substrate-binding domain-containing protein [Owenweeksia hongkongensis]AEV34308.1 ABC-type nitrate/sulfonate/bicarbonate transport system, periplasmic component [Owenweeksia hongkongensis DSM 17368]